MKRLAISSLLILPCLLVLCLSDTAFGQTLTLTDPNDSNHIIDAQHPLNYGPVAPGISGVASQSLVTVTASVFTTVNYAVAKDPATQQPVTWLRIAPGGSGTGQSGGTFNANPSNTMTVQIITQGLVTGTYQSSFTLTAGQNSVTITVNLTVGTGGSGGGGALSANPSSLNFTATQGGTTTSPASYSVLISSSTTTLSFNLTSTCNGQVSCWLQLSNTTGVTGTAFTVSANPSGLNAGTYTANLLVQSTTTTDFVNIAISLVVSGTGTLTVSPANPPPFLYQVGGAFPQAQVITVSSSVAINFSINTNATWLVPSTLSGFAGPSQNFQFTMSASTSGLALGTTNATLFLTPQGGNAQSVPFSIVVSNNALLSASPTLLTFSTGFSGTPPPNQTVNISATGNGSAIPFQVTSDSAWLSASLTQNVTPSTMTVQVNQGSMAVGNYVGTLSVRPTNGDNYSINITVNLAIGTTQQVTAGPPVLLFSYQTTKALPPAQTISINSTGQAVSFTYGVQINTCPGSWLFVQPLNALTTPSTLQVTIGAPGPTSGTCTGAITITPSSGNPLTINVIVTVAATPLLAISMQPGFGYVSIQQGSGNGISQFISVNSTDNANPLAFTASPIPVTGGNWLFLNSSQGNTPQNIGMIIQPGTLGPGVYTSNIVISSTTLPGGSFTIPVQLTITPNVGITITPSQLSFTAAQNGPLPAPQTLTLTNTGGNPTFTATISSNCQSFLQLDKTSGAATGNLTVSVFSTSGSIGTFNCQIQFSYFNAATQGVNVAVSVTINTPRTISASTQSLAFAYQLTQAAPATQKITLSSTGGAVQFSVGVSSSGWLSVDTTNATTPKDVVVSISTTGLTVAGSPYTGQISITAPGVLANPLNIPVTLTVTAPPNPQPVTVTSTATNLAGTIAAGELITIKGTLLGPTTAGGVLFSLNASGGVNSTLSGVRVLFDGIPGIPIFVSAGQINVSVPYEIAGRLSTNIVVEYNGNQSAPVGVRVSDSAPGLFTLNSTGSGQSAAVNGNGTFNGPPGGGTTPATLGSTGAVVIVYGTGGGQTNPPGQTGTVTPVPQTLSQLMRIPGIVSATVGGAAARVDYAGQAPGLITGIMQFNLFLAPGTPTGNNQQVVITVNGISSSSGATVAVAP